jgi:hypothetical protein
MEELRTWSVGTDGGVVTASCPEPLRFVSGTRPEWMGRCSSAIRDALRELPIEDGTILEATLCGVPPHAAELEDMLLYSVGIPETQVHAGVRLRRAPAVEPGVVQRYRRVPIATAAGDEDEALLAAVQVPIAGVYQLDSAASVWLAVRRAVVATLPPRETAASGGIQLRIRLATGSEREHGSIELIKKLLDGIGDSFYAYAGANLEETARGLAAELEQGQAEMSMLLSSPHGALLAAGERLGAADVTIVPGARPQLEIELRALYSS